MDTQPAHRELDTDVDVMPSPPLATDRATTDRPASWISSLNSPARICVAGSGAIGGTLAVRLSASGHNVSVIARGDHLAAIKRSGLRLIDHGNDIVADVQASDHAAFGLQDVIFVSVKAHGLSEMLPMIAPMIGPETVIVPTINGMPWWYFQGEGGRFDGQRIHAVDPEGALQRALPWQHIVGCVVYIAAHVAGPGAIVTTNHNRIILGEPSHQPSARVDALCRHLERAGVKAEATRRIRDAIWTKLMANLATNPLSVVTGATIGGIHNEEGLRRIVETIMRETLRVGQACGAQFDVDIDALMEIGRNLGPFKTSMLQDFEKGHALELAGIGDAVVELAARCDIPIPAIQMILSLARFRSQQALAKA
jgi:2-dehydropantoate 2-reductase